MLNSLLTDFHERDLRKLIEEVDAFKNEGNLWRTHGSVKNSAGNLVLHIVGGSYFLIGATLGQPVTYVIVTRSLPGKEWQELSW